MTQRLRDFNNFTEFCTLSDWQQRVVQERAELAKKIVSLQTFVVGPDFYFVDEKVQELMHAQLVCMQGYEEVLRKRIAQF